MEADNENVAITCKTQKHISVFKTQEGLIKAHEKQILALQNKQDYNRIWCSAMLSSQGISVKIQT